MDMCMLIIIYHHINKKTYFHLQASHILQNPYFLIVNNDFVFLFILACSKIYMSRVYLLFNTTTTIIKYILLHEPTFSR